MDQNQLFPFRPDWSDAVAYSIQFLTEIFSSRDGREWRRAQRVMPRTTIAFSGWSRGAKMQNYLQAMQSVSDRSLYWANVLFRQKISAPVVAGATIFSVVSVPEWLTAGSVIVLIEGDSLYLATVDSIAGTDITMTAASTVSFSSAAYVCPAYLFRIDQQTTVSFPVNGVAQCSAKLNGEPGDNYVPGNGTAFDLFNSKEVFLRKPNWSGPVSLEFDQAVDLVDYGFGPIGADDYLDYVPYALKASYSLFDYASIMEFIEFFIRMAGRQGEFYMPSWLNEMTITTAITSGSTTLQIEGEIFYTLKSNPALKNIFIAKRDGTFVYNTISDMTLGSGVTNCTVSAWGTDIALDEIMYVGWLNCYRFGSDQLDINFRTDSIAELDASFQVLYDLPEAA